MRNGTLTLSHDAWFLRVYVGTATRKDKAGKVIRDSKTGRPKRFAVQRAFRLGHKSEFMNKGEVRRKADEKMLQLRKAGSKGASSIGLDLFLRFWYLGVAKEQVRPSTYREYKGMYERYIRGREEAQHRLWEYDTAKCQQLLQGIADDHQLSKTSLQHIKHFLSGAFRTAALAGLREGNPVTLTKIPRNTAPANKPIAYDLATVQRVLRRLRSDKQAVAAVSIAAFAGLRLSEIAGLQWDDYGADELTVRRTRVNGVEGLPKSEASGAAVPVVPPLALALNRYRKAANGNSRMFDCDLVALGRRRVSKAFRAAKAEWHGWHCFRRGLASTLFQLGTDDLTVQKILRHSEVVVTRESYIRVRDEKVQLAMERLTRELSKRVASK
jgi:integrase